MDWLFIALMFVLFFFFLYESGIWHILAVPLSFYICWKVLKWVVPMYLSLLFG
jgi:hypothetical protein